MSKPKKDLGKAVKKALNSQPVAVTPQKLEKILKRAEAAQDDGDDK